MLCHLIDQKAEFSRSSRSCLKPHGDFVTEIVTKPWHWGSVFASVPQQTSRERVCNSGQKGPHSSIWLVALALDFGLRNQVGEVVFWK